MERMNSQINGNNGVSSKDSDLGRLPLRWAVIIMVAIGAAVGVATMSGHSWLAIPTFFGTIMTMHRVI